MILYSLYYIENHPDGHRTFLGIFDSEKDAQEALSFNLSCERKKLPHAHISECNYSIDEWDTNVTVWIAQTDFKTKIFATPSGARSWLQAEIDQHRIALNESMSAGSLGFSWSWRPNWSQAGETIELKWFRSFEGIRVAHGGITGSYYPFKIQD